MSSLIDPVLLRPHLGPWAGRFDVDALAVCDSTSSELMRRAAGGAPAGTVVVADEQTAGRGRRGREWISSPQDSLTFSLLWRFPGGFERLAGLSLAVGVAVARACDSLGAQGVALKWPNDVLVPAPGGWAKLAGILVELSGERDSMLAVIGIGLNLRAPVQDLGQPVRGLADLVPAMPDRHQLLACLLRELAEVLERFAAGGFPALRAEWQQRHAWQDTPVRLVEDGVTQAAGLCRGADRDGALLIETAAGVQRHLAGDVSLRPA